MLAPMAYNQGFYNLFLAIITLVGVALLGGSTTSASPLALAGTGSMLARRPRPGDPRPVDGARRDHPGHCCRRSRCSSAAVDAGSWARPGGATGRARCAPSETTDAPSPVADATRFIDPARMSPPAKMPGTVVARSAGGTSSTHCSRRDVAPGEHEAALVAQHRVRQPAALRGRAEEQEQPARLDPLLSAGVDVLHVEPGRGARRRRGRRRRRVSSHAR